MQEAKQTASLRVDGGQDIIHSVVHLRCSKNHDVTKCKATEATTWERFTTVDL